MFPHEAFAMNRFSIDDINALISYNRQRISQLTANAPADPLMQRVVRQLEMSIKSVERHRDEMMSKQSRSSPF
jgi:FixJ family two-component response regulator